MLLKTDASPRSSMDVLRSALVLSSLSISSAAYGAYQGELIVFPEATALHRYNEREMEDQDKSPSVNFLYTAHAKRLRIVTEYVFGKEEQEVERLQLGWQTTPMATLWAGRFHAPMDFWNITHHHGAYLQTTISRPATALFEEHDGILPQHISGVFWDAEQWVTGHTVNYLLAAGAGPELTAEGLEPVDIFRPADGDHRTSLSAAVALQPYDSLLSTVGIFGTHTEIPSSHPQVDRVRQWSLGVYAAAQLERTRVIASLLHLNDEVRARDGAEEEDSFIAGYAQGEYTLRSDWTLYGRLEGTMGGNGDAYLALFPHYVHNRALLGFRYELTHRQALKVELSSVQTLDHRREEAGIQWSAVFP